MFTFRNATILFFLMLLALNLSVTFLCKESASFFCHHPGWFYGGLVFMYAGISLAMAFLPCSGYHYPVVCKAATAEKKVALTFDDGPDPVFTPAVLDELRRHDIPASFFLIGSRIAGNELLVRRILDEGHLVGSHSWSHGPGFDFLTTRKMKQDLAESSDAIQAVCGKKTALFRPPYGVINPTLAGALSSFPWTVVGWSVRSFDTLSAKPEKILKRILRKVRPGAVILLHDHTRFTQTRLSELIDRLHKAGYRIVPLDELLNITAYVE